MWKLLTTLASQGSTLTVLYHHRVFAQQDPMMPGEPTAEFFDRMLGWLQSQFNVLPLHEAVRRLANGTLPPAAAAITFDDGYRDNLEVAAPLLQRRGLPATFFVASGFLDGGIMFNDVVIECMRRSPLDSVAVPELGLHSLPLRNWAERSQAAGAVLNAVKYLPAGDREAAVQRLPALCRAELPRDLMLTTPQLRELANLPGFEIGGHTDWHPILARLADEDALGEITRGRDRLQALLDRRMRLFAYPNGRRGQDFDERHRAMAKACGFDAAFTTEPHVGRSGCDPWSLPRFTPWDRTEWRFRLRLLARQRRHLEVQAPAPASASAQAHRA
jgi:peptidoglycan/xylan/chitin deacetylase (PgdA/CDA1 family)